MQRCLIRGKQKDGLPHTAAKTLFEGAMLG